MTALRLGGSPAIPTAAPVAILMAAAQAATAPSAWNVPIALSLPNDRTPEVVQKAVDGKEHLHITLQFSLKNPVSLEDRQKLAALVADGSLPVPRDLSIRLDDLRAHATRPGTLPEC